jgi:hypothetical protein
MSETITALIQVSEYRLLGASCFIVDKIWTGKVTKRGRQVDSAPGADK